MSQGRRKSKNPQKCLGEFKYNENMEIDRRTQNVEDASNEMTLEEVMESSKLKVFGECLKCRLLFKDWKTTTSHIQLHRINNEPKCCQER